MKQKVLKLLTKLRDSKLYYDSLTPRELQCMKVLVRNGYAYQGFGAWSGKPYYEYISHERRTKGKLDKDPA